MNPGTPGKLRSCRAGVASATRDASSGEVSWSSLWNASGTSFASSARKRADGAPTHAHVCPPLVGISPAVTPGEKNHS